MEGNKAAHGTHDPVINSLAHVVGATLFNHGWNVTPNRFLTKFVLLNVLIMGLLLYMHWEGMLISFLATLDEKLPFKDVEELWEKTNMR